MTPEDKKALQSLYNMVLLYLRGQCNHRYPPPDLSGYYHDSKVERKYYSNVCRRLAAKYMVKFYLLSKKVGNTNGLKI